MILSFSSVSLFFRQEITQVNNFNCLHNLNKKIMNPNASNFKFLPPRFDLGLTFPKNFKASYIWDEYIDVLNNKVRFEESY